MTKIVSMSTKSTVTIVTVGLLSAGLYGCTDDHKDTKLSSCKASNDTCTQNTTMFEQYFNYSLAVENEQANATKSEAVKARCAQAGGVWKRQFEAARTDLKQVQDFKQMKDLLTIMQESGQHASIEVTFLKFHDADGSTPWLFHRVVSGTVSLQNNEVELQYREKVQMTTKEAEDLAKNTGGLILEQEGATVRVKEVVSDKLKVMVQRGDILLEVGDKKVSEMSTLKVNIDEVIKTSISAEVELHFQVKEVYDSEKKEWFENEKVVVTEDNWAHYQVVVKTDADKCHAAGGMITSDYNKEKPSVKCVTLKNWLDFNHRADGITSEERCTFVNNHVLPQAFPSDKGKDDDVVIWVDDRCVVAKPCEAIWEKFDSKYFDEKKHPVHPLYPYCKAKPITGAKDAWKSVQCMEISRLDSACVADQKRGVCGYYGVQTAVELAIGKGMCQFTNSSTCSGASAPATKAGAKKAGAKKAGAKKVGDKKAGDKKADDEEADDEQ